MVSAYKDKTFCASPNCTNECGRKMPPQDKERLSAWTDPERAPLVSYAYFCGEPNDNKGELDYNSPYEKEL